MGRHVKYIHYGAIITIYVYVCSLKPVRKSNIVQHHPYLVSVVTNSREIRRKSHYFVAIVFVRGYTKFDTLPPS